MQITRNKLILIRNIAQVKGEIIDLKFLCSVFKSPYPSKEMDFEYMERWKSFLGDLCDSYSVSPKYTVTINMEKINAAIGDGPSKPTPTGWMR